MTDSEESSEASEDLDEVQPVASGLRPAQHQGFRSGGSEEGVDSVEDDGEVSRDGKLDELAPVSSAFRPAQSRRGGEVGDDDRVGGDGDD